MGRAGKGGGKGGGGGGGGGSGSGDGRGGGGGSGGGSNDGRGSSDGRTHHHSQSRPWHRSTMAVSIVSLLGALGALGLSQLAAEYAQGSKSLESMSDIWRSVIELGDAAPSVAPAGGVAGDDDGYGRNGPVDAHQEENMCV